MENYFQLEKNLRPLSSKFQLLLIEKIYGLWVECLSYFQLEIEAAQACSQIGKTYIGYPRDRRL